MLLTSILRALPAALLLVGAQASPVAQADGERHSSPFDSFVKSQAEISIKGVLANIGTDGSKAQGAAAGIVVASPSRSDPDCEFMSCLRPHQH